jgi:hypothetical protein
MAPERKWQLNIQGNLEEFFGDYFNGLAFNDCWVFGIMEKEQLTREIRSGRLIRTRMRRSFGRI